MKDFRKLNVWQKSHELTLQIYKNTRAFPKEEIYGLTSQIRRSSISIPSNIAEGCGRNSDLDFARFLQIAMGSASELEYQTLLAYDLHYLDENTYIKLLNEIEEVKKMLAGLIQKLKAEG
ncbi:MAG: four helix bundle protein [Candidatus Zhuqueibacterota bacterium]